MTGLKTSDPPPTLRGIVARSLRRSAQGFDDHALFLERDGEEPTITVPIRDLSERAARIADVLEGRR